jgi:hypothetical protein
MKEEFLARSELENIATMCAYRQLYKKCNEVCTDCHLNLRRYMNMTDAENDMLLMYGGRKAVALRRSIVGKQVLKVLAAALLTVVLYKCYIPQLRPTKQAIQVVYDNTVETTLKQSSSLFLKQLVDVNQDGLYDCIDAAVLFYDLYPNKGDVQITRNINTREGFNHLFNSVRLDGKWVAVEPQRADGDMRCWGRSYDPKYNKDETEKWTVYLTKRK